MRRTFQLPPLRLRKPPSDERALRVSYPWPVRLNASEPRGWHKYETAESSEQAYAATFSRRDLDGDVGGLTVRAQGAPPMKRG